VLQKRASQYIIFDQRIRSDELHPLDPNEVYDAAAHFAGRKRRPTVQSCSETDREKATLWCLPPANRSVSLRGYLPLHRHRKFHQAVDNPGMEPHAIFTILNELYSMFDVMAVALDVYKVETIGDSYFAVGGLFNRQSVESCFRVGVFALAAQEFVRGEFGKRTGIQIRVGLHTGDVATGVLGYSRPRFVIIGDTVNTASRMESTSSIDTVQVTHTTEKLLSRFFKLTERSEVAVKGKGTMRTYTLCELREDVPRDFRPGCLQLSPQDLVILARKYVLDQTNMARSNMSEIQHTHTKYETAPTSGLMNLVNLQYDARLSPSHHRRGSHNWTGVDMGRLRSMSDDLLRLRSPESSSSIACMFKSCDESDLTSVTEGRLRCHSMP